MDVFRHVCPGCFCGALSSGLPILELQVVTLLLWSPTWSVPFHFSAVLSCPLPSFDLLLASWVPVESSRHAPVSEFHAWCFLFLSLFLSRMEHPIPLLPLKIYWCAPFKETFHSCPVSVLMLPCIPSCCLDPFLALCFSPYQLCLHLTLYPLTLYCISSHWNVNFVRVGYFHSVLCSQCQKQVS